MTRFRDFPWWPNAWVDDENQWLSTSELRKTAVLKNVRKMGAEIALIVEHNGASYTAKVDSQLSADFLILLRHILLQNWGQPLSVVEDIEVDFSIFQNPPA